MSVSTRCYGERAKAHPHKLAKRLLTLMESKQTNLCVSVDVTTKTSFLRIVDAVGPYVCMIKTHIDILSDFDADLVQQLQRLSKKHDFLIFEDRKFADIGNTVKLQYESGIYKIATWAHITNAHSVPGDGIVTGLKAVGLPLERGLLLLAEMSSQGSFATGSYTSKTVDMARRHKEFVMGFVAGRRVDADAANPDPSSLPDDFLCFSPGVGLATKGDAMGQQYRTPKEVIGQCGSDIIIVGRGIYGAGEGSETSVIVEEAKRYKEAGWTAYLARIA
ncbi:uncharacterized protein L969DRAFT_86588 [Mixia osmundae IAM 14324]|uniref:Orotidine 5'-phosphate decarboxylase n=1 Tax=Mixia osmundae (strain CBS 9802 / IAM 14324 / JCM 22182 / KY 12970) TaxID=764103 RepID=G7E9N2_MIXOS|nr:uncharacterized protein L969DRAFT_86588 [Mixia osmundae IAM 14324]KEI39981.1 hypothetical protein L969DRAFT_86588 [Mixia osmundae IAM 14324]GAA99351.1 hypothetical protein E5Q_06046 [Mixia osmundae IAM 14324]